MGGNPEALPALELCPVPPRIIHRPEEHPDRPISARPFPAAGRRRAACAPAAPREGQGLVAPITCTSVICEPSARRIFSVLVGYGLSRCLYNHCFRGRAMSCRACRLCRTFPPFCRALRQRERRGCEPRPPLRPRGSCLHASQPAWTPVPRARTWRRHWRCQREDGQGVTGQGHQLYTERGWGWRGEILKPEAGGLGGQICSAGLSPPGAQALPAVYTLQESSFRDSSPPLGLPVVCGQRSPLDGGNKARR